MERAKLLYSHAHGIFSSVIAHINAGLGVCSSTENLTIDLLFLVIVNNMTYAELDIVGDESHSAAHFFCIVCESLDWKKTWSRLTSFSKMLQSLH
jgi:hypothetical protein